MTLEFGSECLIPSAPAVRSNDPILHAWPTHHVAMGGNTYCIVSYMPSPAVTEPPVMSAKYSITSRHWKAFYKGNTMQSVALSFKPEAHDTM